ncbi:DUF5689 domain-containing protein [Lutibacter flavus]|uniref:Lamin Tail Domain n=1 Tax=Lutibacter flavus TaxID=691689 RepID=A0A238X6A9_9FLAO|nr:DUF5689 domain-containing protein [Lutibacter flavus]SNR54111.1 Lamin Tail Domain [Lutibacter flavus]
MKIFKYLTTSLFVILAFSGCVKDADYSTPIVDCSEPSIMVTNTISQVKDMYTFGGATKIETDVVIEGYVVSSDKSGNIYKSLSIQDKPENPTVAIKISIDRTDIYTTYNVGRKIYIKLKGLAVGYSFGSVQIGLAKDTDLGRIPSTEVDKYIFRSCEVAEIVPKKVTINELDKSMLEILVEIENVQFKANEIGNPYANVDNTTTVNRVLENFNSSCNLLDEVIVRNSGFSDFKNQLLPEGKGSVVAIFSNYYDDYQLYLRDTDDVKFSEPRCDYSNALQPNITIAEVAEMYTGNLFEFGVGNNYVIEGYLVSSDENGNFKERIVIQDEIKNPTSGIQLLIENENIFEHYNIGDKVFVKLDKLYMTKENGALTLGYAKGSSVKEINEEEVDKFIYNSGERFIIVPTEIIVSDIQNPAFQNTLVKVLDVQLVETELQSAFAFFSGTNDGTRTLESCNEPTKLSVFTDGDANFANELFPTGHGSIVGVLNNHLEIRSIDDVIFNEAFEVCPIIVPKIMITEVADPKNSVSSRFVELFNAGETAIDLSGWKLNKYLNGSTSVSGSGVNLTGLTIPVGGFVIIANTGYLEIFNSIPTLESNYISGNGDDVYELIDNTGATIDIYGVIGEDGNGTNWEYLDGQAVRNLDVLEPNPIFTFGEWTVYSNATNNLINYQNTPKNAPNDYNPNYR